MTGLFGVGQTINGLPGAVIGEMCGGCGNCIEILLYLCRCRCETGTCRRPDPGGFWEMVELQSLCAGWRSLKSGISRSGRCIFMRDGSERNSTVFFQFNRYLNLC